MQRQALQEASFCGNFEFRDRIFSVLIRDSTACKLSGAECGSASSDFQRRDTTEWTAAFADVGPATRQADHDEDDLEGFLAGRGRAPNNPGARFSLSIYVLITRTGRPNGRSTAFLLASKGEEGAPTRAPISATSSIPFLFPAPQGHLAGASAHWSVHAGSAAASVIARQLRPFLLERHNRASLSDERWMWRTSARHQHAPTVRWWGVEAHPLCSRNAGTLFCRNYTNLLTIQLTLTIAQANAQTFLHS
ncbi:hypothetical protein MRX96_030650 [Rhipicephalus microplus]